MKVSNPEDRALIINYIRELKQGYGMSLAQKRVGISPYNYNLLRKIYPVVRRISNRYAKRGLRKFA